jgi:glycosyltransferase 2 family protein
MDRTRGLLLFAIKVAISLALLYVAIHFVNFSILRERLYRLNYTWIAAALTVLGLQLALVSLRWQRIAEFGGGNLSASRAVLYTLIGSFFSQVLPSTVGGDAARIWLLARDAGAWKNAIFSVLIDRFVGLIWLAVLVLICLPWSIALIANPIGRTALIIIGVAGAVAPIGLFVLSLLGGTSIARLKVVRHLADIAKTAWTVLTSPRTGPVVAAISIAVHLMTVVVLWFCARAVGSSFTFLNTLLLIPPVILISAVPISIAGWGVRESAMIAAFTYAGLPESDGLLVSILFGASSFVIGAAGGIAWSLSANRVRFRSLREAKTQAMDV